MFLQSDPLNIPRKDFWHACGCYQSHPGAFGDWPGNGVVTVWPGKEIPLEKISSNFSISTSVRLRLKMLLFLRTMLQFIAKCGYLPNREIES